MKIFLTGGSGFIGGRLASQLVEAGHRVTALVRDPQRAGSLVDLGVRLARGDVTDAESVRAAMAGADAVFHVAGWYKLGERDSSPAEQVNVVGTRNVLEAMKALKIPKGVYTSTLAVFSDTHGKLVDETYRYHGPHLSEYDRTKAKAHYEVAEPLMRAGLPLVIVMPGLVYGPGDTGPMGRVLADYLDGRLPLAPIGTAYAWAHVEDIAHAHVLALSRGKPGETYIIAGEACSLIDALGMAEKITGIKAPRLHAPVGVLKAGAALMRGVEKVVRVPVTFSSEGLRVAAGSTYLGSNAKARRELGFNPRPLEVGLRETLEYMLAERDG